MVWVQAETLFGTRWNMVMTSPHTAWYRSKPRPDLSAGKSKRTRQTARYSAGWGQMYECRDGNTQTKLGLLQINTYTVLVPRPCQYMQTGHRKKTTKEEWKTTQFSQANGRSKPIHIMIKVGEEGTGEDDRLKAKNLVNMKVIKLQRNVPINWRDTWSCSLRSEQYISPDRKVMPCSEVGQSSGYFSGLLESPILHCEYRNIEWICLGNCAELGVQPFPLYLWIFKSTHCSLDHYFIRL